MTVSVRHLITDKGREEIRNLIASELVNDWAETSRALKNTVRMLLAMRPDLLALYFQPQAWAQISGVDKPRQAKIILAVMKAVVVEQAGEPAVVNWTQALFYMNTREPKYMAMAEQWSRKHPEECKYPLRAEQGKPLLPDGRF